MSNEQNKENMHRETGYLDQQGDSAGSNSPARSDATDILQQIIREAAAASDVSQNSGNPLAANGPYEAVEPAVSPNIIRLLALAAEAEQQARLTAEAAQTAGDLALQLLSNMQKTEGSPPDAALQQLSLTAGENAIMASEAALKAQMGAMEAHAAAVNQSLSELENAKSSLHQESQEYINLSKQAAQANEEAARAREAANKARLEYTAKHNVAVSTHEALLQYKKDYEYQQRHVQQAQETLDMAQKKSRQSHQEYLVLQDKLQQRRSTWQGLQTMQRARPAEAQPEMEVPQPPPGEQIKPQPTMPLDDEPTLPVKPAPLSTQPATGLQPEPPISQTPPPVITPEPVTTAPVTQPETTAAQPPIWTSESAMSVSAAEHALPAPTVKKRQAEREKTGSKFLTVTKVFMVTLCIVIVLFVAIFNLVYVEGQSMLPTLNPNDVLIYSRISFWFGDPQRGDIVLLEAPDDPDSTYVKRIIGLPNEQVTIADGKVWIDGIALEEDYLPEGTITTLSNADSNIEAIIVPDGEYYVLGDNRAVSRDSRISAIGTIAREKLRGKPLVRFLPWAQRGLL